MQGCAQGPPGHLWQSQDLNPNFQPFALFTPPPCLTPSMLLESSQPCVGRITGASHCGRLGWVAHGSDPAGPFQRTQLVPPFPLLKPLTGT